MSSSVSKATADRHQRILLDLLKQPGNNVCADCKSANPRWAAWNLGIFVCVKCAGVHRKMGTHISKVKSLTLDAWSKEQVDRMKAGGNLRSNAMLNPNEIQNPPPTDFEETERDSQLERWMRQKYERRAFAAAPVPVPVPLHSPAGSVTSFAGFAAPQPVVPPRRPASSVPVHLQGLAAAASPPRSVAPRPKPSTPAPAPAPAHPGPSRSATAPLPDPPPSAQTASRGAQPPPHWAPLDRHAGGVPPPSAYGSLGYGSPFGAGPPGALRAATMPVTSGGGPSAIGNPALSMQQQQRTGVAASNLGVGLGQQQPLQPTRTDGVWGDLLQLSGAPSGRGAEASLGMAGPTPGFGQPPAPAAPQMGYNPFLQTSQAVMQQQAFPPAFSNQPTAFAAPLSQPAFSQMQHQPLAQSPFAQPNPFHGMMTQPPNPSNPFLAMQQQQAPQHQQGAINPMYQQGQQGQMGQMGYQQHPQPFENGYGQHFF